MFPSHHIHIGLAFRAALVGSALLLAAKSAGLAAEGLGAFDPDQAIVFDGSIAARDVFTLALKNEGYLVELNQIGFVCPDADHVSEPGLFALIEEAGVFTLEHEIGESLLLPAPAAAGLPPELEGLDSDCELLEFLPALENYRLFVTAQAEARLLEAAACRDRVRALYCRVVDAIEDAETLIGIGTEAALQSANGGYYGSLESLGSPGQPCPGVKLLAETPGALDNLSSLTDICEGQESVLASLEAEVAGLVQANGGLTSGEKALRLGEADALLGNAESSFLDAAGTVAGLEAALPALTEESLEASCAECSGPVPIGVLSGAVQLVVNRQGLGRFVGAFHSAANHADDPELAARLEDLAGRLAAVPNHRVLQVIFPGASAVGQHLLAVRSPLLPDDGESPLVVVLTALASDAPLPATNGADLQFLFEHVRLFEDTLAREPGLLEAH